MNIVVQCMTSSYDLSYGRVYCAFTDHVAAQAVAQTVHH